MTIVYVSYTNWKSYFGTAPNALRLIPLPARRKARIRKDRPAFSAAFRGGIVFLHVAARFRAAVPQGFAFGGSCCETTVACLSQGSLLCQMHGFAQAQMTNPCALLAGGQSPAVLKSFYPRTEKIPPAPPRSIESSILLVSWARPFYNREPLKIDEPLLP
jgi:hypothetical protein